MGRLCLNFYSFHDSGKRQVGTTEVPSQGLIYSTNDVPYINTQLDPKCSRCNLEVGNFWHMVWSCLKLHPYCEAIVTTLSDICGISVPPLDPLVLLLSQLEHIEGDKYTKLCLTFTLFYAR